MSDSDRTKKLEEGKELMLDFTKLERAVAQAKGILPVAVQNADTKEVILVAYANEEALEHTIKTRLATFWSTSRGELWVKGATSGETFEVVEIRVNCEQNSLLYVARATQGNICHTMNSAGKPRNCYYRRINLDTRELENLDP